MKGYKPMPLEIMDELEAGLASGKLRLVRRGNVLKAVSTRRKRKPKGRRR